MFGIEPVKESIIPSTESLELLIEKLESEGKFEGIILGVERPFILVNDGKMVNSVFLDDAPRLRQMYYNYKCFRRAKVRLDSLNFALKYIRSRKCDFEFFAHANLREIMVQGQKMAFIYEYCLSEAFLKQLTPEENSIIVNLHNWNGENCISPQAYSLAEKMRVRLSRVPIKQYLQKFPKWGRFGVTSVTPFLLLPVHPEGCTPAHRT